MKLYVFNPDADMALGNNEENYMAPATIRRMAEDLALLPIWYAQPGSGVLASSAYNADYLKQMQQLFRLDVHLVTEPELPDYADVRVMPWGWNPAIRKRMLKGGVLEKNLPTPDAGTLQRESDHHAAGRDGNSGELQAVRHFRHASYGRKSQPVCHSRRIGTLYP